VPRASRYQLPGSIWHVAPRGHRKRFLPKFERDHRGWAVGLCEAHRKGHVGAENGRSSWRNAFDVDETDALWATCIGPTRERPNPRKVHSPRGPGTFGVTPGGAAAPERGGRAAGQAVATHVL